MAFVFAAAHPERTFAMVLIDGAARYRRDVDYPAGVPDRFVEPIIHAVTGTRDGFLVNYAPSLASDDRFVEWFHRFNRLAAGPSLQPKMFRTGFDWDLRAILPTIRVPTLVIHRAENRYLWAPHGRFLAENIEGARYVELPGADAAFFAGDQDAILDELEPFLTGERKEHERDRILATVLFTDIVSSTERAAQLGDRRWRALLETHDGIVRQLIAEFRGREVKTMGDGFLATFDGPARGIRCAQAIAGQLRPLGLENRAGLHTGEVELRGDDVHGIGVHIAARVMAEAGPGEVVVSSTVKDLVVGSGIAFEDRGTHRLKGVPDEWRLYSVTS
jgi:class 3 adenylate cyclase